MHAWEPSGSGLCNGSRPNPRCCPGCESGLTLQTEVEGLLLLLCSLRETHLAPLRVLFVDSLVMLNKLQPWGKANFNQDPNDVVHFDVILSLLEALQWPHPVRLIKIKVKLAAS
jgi:hypothetical protein